jgi:hypothetical protein
VGGYYDSFQQAQTQWNGIQWPYFQDAGNFHMTESWAGVAHQSDPRTMPRYRGDERSLNEEQAADEKCLRRMPPMMAVHWNHVNY